MGLHKNMGLVGPKAHLGVDVILLCQKREIWKLVYQPVETLFQLIRRSVDGVTVIIFYVFVVNSCSFS